MLYIYTAMPEENLLALIPGELIAIASRTLPPAETCEGEQREVEIDVPGRFRARVLFKPFLLQAREDEPMVLDGGNGGSGKVTGTFSILLAPICATARPLGADTFDALLERGLSFDRAGTKRILSISSRIVST
jgi:hypothetical protein